MESPRHQVEECTLATSGRTHDDVQLPGLKPRTHTFQYLQFPCPLRLSKQPHRHPRLLNHQTAVIQHDLNSLDLFPPITGDGFFTCGLVFVIAFWSRRRDVDIDGFVLKEDASDEVEEDCPTNTDNDRDCFPALWKAEGLEDELAGIFQARRVARRRILLRAGIKRICEFIRDKRTKCIKLLTLELDLLHSN